MSTVCYCATCKATLTTEAGYFGCQRCLVEHERDTLRVAQKNLITKYNELVAANECLRAELAQVKLDHESAATAYEDLVKVLAERNGEVERLHSELTEANEGKVHLAEQLTLALVRMHKAESENTELREVAGAWNRLAKELGIGEPEAAS